MRIALSTLQSHHRLTYDVDIGVDEAAGLLDAMPTAPVHVCLSAQLNEDRILVSVAVNGQVNALCDLCGLACVAPLRCTLEDEIMLDAPCYDPIEQVYDLSELIDEAVVMSSPRVVRCKPDCKGLCPKCGANLNYVTCDCEQSDGMGRNPFAALQDLFSTGGAKNGSTKM